MTIGNVGNARQEILAAFKPSGATKGGGLLYDKTARILADILDLYQINKNNARLAGFCRTATPVAIMKQKAEGVKFLECLYKRLGIPFDAKTAVKLSPVETAKIFAQRLNTMSVKELNWRRKENKIFSKSEKQFLKAFLDKMEAAIESVPGSVKKVVADVPPLQINKQLFDINKKRFDTGKLVKTAVNYIKKIKV